MVSNDQPEKSYINMPIFLKSKAVFTLELKFLVLNFSNANPKKILSA